MPDAPNQFYGLARGIAEIVLNHSWEENKVIDVLLYGSALTGSAPDDIDLLVLHSNGANMGNYTGSKSQPSEGQDILYLSPSEILRTIGYRKSEGMENGVFERVYRLLAEAGVIQLDGGTFNPAQLNKILDLHVLNTHLLRESSDPLEFALFLAGVSSEKRAMFTMPYNPRFDARISQLRQEAMRLSGKDLGFYHNILGNGRLYDFSTRDFTARFEDKYQDKLKLFQPV